MIHSQRMVEALWKEPEQGSSSNTNTIYVVGPVDQQSAPDHCREHREVDPVKPANRERVFFFEPNSHVLQEVSPAFRAIHRYLTHPGCRALDLRSGALRDGNSGSVYPWGTLSRSDPLPLE